MSETTHSGAGTTLDPETLFLRPDAYPLEFGQASLDLVPMTRETYRNSVFLDRGRIVPAARRGWQLPLPGLLDEFERRGAGQSPLNFIFHIAHCGSTLLARAMELERRTLVLREPFPLRQLGAEAATTPTGPRDAPVWRRCLALTAALLGRRYADDQAVIVKANVPVNFILRPLMSLHPDSRGLLLYTGLERYVLSVLKTPMHRRWVGNVCRQLAGGIQATPELGQPDLRQLSTPQAAACLWAAQMLRFRSALVQSSRLRSLDCETFFAQPEQTLTRSLQHFGVDLPSAEAGRIAASELFSHHAKDTARRYSRETRERELDQLRASLAGDLEAARQWVEDAGLGDMALPQSSALDGQCAQR